MEATKTRPKAPATSKLMSITKAEARNPRNPTNYKRPEPKEQQIPWDTASTILLVLAWGRFARCLPGTGIRIGKQLPQAVLDGVEFGVHTALKLTLPVL